MTVYNKIVLDLMPEIIAAEGRVPVVRTLDAAATREALIAKLSEEGAELLAAMPDDAAGELADLPEVVRALAAEYDIDWEVVVRSADDKAVGRRGFSRRISLSVLSLRPTPADFRRPDRTIGSPAPSINLALPSIRVATCRE